MRERKVLRPGYTMMVATEVGEMLTRVTAWPIMQQLLRDGVEGRRWEAALRAPRATHVAAERLVRSGGLHVYTAGDLVPDLTLAFGVTVGTPPFSSVQKLGMYQLPLRPGVDTWDEADEVKTEGRGCAPPPACRAVGRRHARRGRGGPAARKRRRSAGAACSARPPARVTAPVAGGPRHARRRVPHARSRGGGAGGGPRFPCRVERGFGGQRLGRRRLGPQTCTASAVGIQTSQT
jgi:hypothetical protein